MSTPPPALALKPCTSFIAENVPEALRGLPHWILWEPIWSSTGKEWKWVKTPFRAQDPSKHASSTNPDTWATFEEALEAAGQTGKGIAFVLTLDTGIVGIDYDKCVDQGAVTRNGEWISLFQSYKELSPSGKGVRCFVLGTYPEDRGINNRSHGIEVYGTGRYLTVTGHRLEGAPQDLQAANGELKSLIDFLRPPRVEALSAPMTPVPLEDQELIQRILTARSNQVTNLWNGGNGTDNDASSADFAFLCSLMWWCGNDRQRVKRIALQSGRVRDKWSERRGNGTWLDYQCEAIHPSEEVYRPNVPLSPTIPPTANNKEGASKTRDRAKPQAIVRPLAAFEREPIEFLIRPYIPLGCVSLITGDGGVGKSTFLMALAAAVSRGDRFLPQQTVVEYPSRTVLVMSAEEDPGRRLRPLAEDARGDLTHIHFLEGVADPERPGITFPLNILKHYEVLCGEIDRLRPSLVIIDPLLNVMPDADSNKATEVTAVMSLLNRAASTHRCAILGLRHCGKDDSKRAQHRGLGSVSFTNGARSEFMVVADDSEPERKLVFHVKSNWEQFGANLAYRLRRVDGKDTPVLEWDSAELGITLDQYSARARKERTETKDPRLWEACKDQLRKLLEPGAMAQKLVMRELTPSYGKTTIQRAAKELNVSRDVVNRTTYWRLP